MQEVGELVDLLLGPAPYERVSYAQLLAGAVLDSAEQRDLPATSHADLRVAKALDALGPGRRFVIDYPAEQAVLAQLHETNPLLARRFELVVDGVELANGYFELTDPAAHRERFAADNQLRAELNLPGVDPDQQFLAAIDAGLPSCAGVALGRVQRPLRRCRPLAGSVANAPFAQPHAHADGCARLELWRKFKSGRQAQHDG